MKNFSLIESRDGDYVLAPAYDLLDTSVHFPNEPSAVALDFFADGHFTPRYEVLGFYSSADFVELGAAFGVDEKRVRGMLARFAAARETVLTRIDGAALSSEARALYRTHFLDRLRAIGQ